MLGSSVQIPACWNETCPSGVEGNHFKSHKKEILFSQQVINLDNYYLEEWGSLSRVGLCRGLNNPVGDKTIMI